MQLWCHRDTIIVFILKKYIFVFSLFISIFIYNARSATKFLFYVIILKLQKLFLMSLIVVSVLVNCNKPVTKP